MFVGQKIFFKEDFKKISEQVKERKYSLPTNFSYEIISFINGMLLYKPQKRFKIYDLYTHDFLKKNIKYFKKIYLEKILDKIGENKKEIKNLNNITIWSIFNEKYAAYLSLILGSELIRPIDQNEELEFSNKNNADNSDKIQKNDIPNDIKNEKIEGITKEDSCEMKSNYENKNDNKYSNNNMIDK